MSTEVRAVAMATRVPQNPFLQKRISAGMAFSVEHCLARGISTEPHNSAFIRSCSMAAREFVKTVPRPHPEPKLTYEKRPRPSDGVMIDIIVAAEPPPPELVAQAALAAVEADRPDLVAVLDPMIDSYLKTL
jgi:hypothetical protein